MENKMISDLEKNKLVAVIRNSTYEKAQLSIKSVIDAGFKFIEITLTVPEAMKLIKETIDIYKDQKDIYVGVGTIMNVEEANEIVKLKPHFGVSPIFKKDIANTFEKADIVYIPGVMTVNEIATAMDCGCNFLKLFPGNAISYSYIKSVKGPIKNVKFMVTGGVDSNNIKEWINAGASALGIGGNLTEGIEKNNNIEEVISIAKKYLSEVNG